MVHHVGMPTVPVTYNYVYFGSGPHQRQPTRTTSGPGGFTLIQSNTGAMQTTGDVLPLGAQPENWLVGGHNYQFAFVNVSGGSPSGSNSFVSTQPPPPVTVGSTPIVVLVVYVPTGGGGPGSGATIDSFDETTGTLFNDTFVSVSPDPSGTLKTSGNVEGYVDTTNTETITALSPTSPTGVDFDKWVNLLAPASTIPGAALTVEKGTSISALAFYKAPPPEPPAEVTCQDIVQSLETMIAIGIPGPLFTVAEWTAVQASLKKCVQEGYLTQARMNTLIAEYNTYAHNKNPEPPKPVVKAELK